MSFNLSLWREYLRALDENYPRKEPGRPLLNQIHTPISPIELSLEAMGDIIEIATKAFLESEITSDYREIGNILATTTPLEKRKYLKDIRMLRKRLRGVMILCNAFSGVTNKPLRDLLRTLGTILDTSSLSLVLHIDVLTEVESYKKGALSSLSTDYFKKWHHQQILNLITSKTGATMDRISFHSFRKKVRRIALVYKYISILTTDPTHEYCFAVLITEDDLLGKIHDNSLENNDSEISLDYNFDVIKDFVGKLSTI